MQFEDNSHVRISYNSCRNRHCPKCQSTNKERWIEARLQQLLPVTYFHVVFTLPQESKDEFIIDNTASADFKKVIHDCFDIDYDKIVELVALLFNHFGLEPGDCLSAYKENFLTDAVSHTGKPKSVLESLLSGFTLSRVNKMPISEMIRKPNSVNRYLYRPLLFWTINAKPFYVFGVFSWDEAENSLLLNAIP